MTLPVDSTAQELVLTRLFQAPRALVFRIWTDPGYVAQWWGIEGADNPVCELDVRPGGDWRIEMRTAGGKVYPNRGTYLEVIPDTRLVYSDVPDPGIAEWGGDVPPPRVHTVTFEDEGDRTRVTLRVRLGSPADKARMLEFGMDRGLAQGLDRLARLLERVAI